jgi:hypothetical protein
VFRQKAPGRTNTLPGTLLETSFRVPLTAPFTATRASAEHGCYSYLRAGDNRDILSEKDLEKALEESHLAVAVRTAFPSPRFFYHFYIASAVRSFLGSPFQFEIRKKNSINLSCLLPVD